MNKKTWIILTIAGIVLIGSIAYLVISLQKQKQENKAMLELAELDKKEMENEYMQFANQYSEMKTQISNDSIVAQLTAEQEKTQKLLEELRQVKSSDARDSTSEKRTCHCKSRPAQLCSGNRLSEQTEPESDGRKLKS